MTATRPSDDPLAANLARWEEQVDIHVGSDFYRMKEFLGGESSLDPIVLSEIGTVRGKRLLHLQCHFGLDTLSLAREGAGGYPIVFEEAIAGAERFAKGAGRHGEFE